MAHIEGFNQDPIRLAQESGASGHISEPAAGERDVENFETNALSEGHIAFKGEVIDEAHRVSTLSAGYSKMAQSALRALHARQKALDEERFK